MGTKNIKKYIGIFLFILIIAMRWITALCFSLSPLILVYQFYFNPTELVFPYKVLQGSIAFCMVGSFIAGILWIRRKV